MKFSAPSARAYLTTGKITAAKGHILTNTSSVLSAVMLLLFFPFCSFGDEPSQDVPSKMVPLPMNSTMLANGLTEVARTNQLSITEMENLDNKHRFAIGDQLSFQIIQDEEAPKVLIVNDSGDVDFPYVGRIRVTGRTCREIAEVLKANLEASYYYHATVIIAVDSMTKSRGKVYVVGDVHTAGPVDIPSDEVLTVSKAIFRAGGFADFADQRNVRVTRRGTAASGTEINYTVDVKDVLEKGKVDSDLQLQPGDLVYVPERLVRFY